MILLFVALVLTGLMVYITRRLYARFLWVRLCGFVLQRSRSETA